MDGHRFFRTDWQGRRVVFPMRKAGAHKALPRDDKEAVYGSGVAQSAGLDKAVSTNVFQPQQL